MSLRTVRLVGRFGLVGLLLALALVPGRALTYAEWIGTYGLSPEDAAPLADPDSDGMVNLMEFALAGGDATVFTTQQVQAFVQDEIPWVRVEVSGAPDEDANGIYEPRPSINGYPSWGKGGDVLLFNLDDSEWLIEQVSAVWVYTSNQTNLGGMPWEVVWGEQPGMTVSEVPGGQWQEVMLMGPVQQTSEGVKRHIGIRWKQRPGIVGVRLFAEFENASMQNWLWGDAVCWQWVDGEWTYARFRSEQGVWQNQFARLRAELVEE